MRSVGHYRHRRGTRVAIAGGALDCWRLQDDILEVLYVWQNADSIRKADIHSADSRRVNGSSL